MDVHQKLILLALFCILFMICMEKFFPEKTLWKSWWHPFPSKWYEEMHYVPSTPTLIAFVLLLIALCVRER